MCTLRPQRDSGDGIDPAGEARDAGKSTGISGSAAAARDERDNSNEGGHVVLMDDHWATRVSQAGAKGYVGGALCAQHISSDHSVSVHIGTGGVGHHVHVHHLQGGGEDSGGCN